MLQRALANRLALRGWATRHPEVRVQTIASPWVIVGLPRTGPSILDLPLGTARELDGLMRLNPPLRAMHPSGATLAEECVTPAGTTCGPRYRDIQRSRRSGR